MPVPLDPERLEQVVRAAALLQTTSAAAIAEHIGGGLKASQIRRHVKHERVLAAAEAGKDGEARGLTQATAKVARRSAANAAKELTGAESIRLQLIADAKTWLATPYGKRAYAYRVNDKGLQVGEPLIPADIQYGLDLARDRGRDDGAERLLAERSRIEREAAEPADAPQPGDTVIVEVEGFDLPGPRALLPAVETDEDAA